MNEYRAPALIDVIVNRGAMLGRLIMICFAFGCGGSVKEEQGAVVPRDMAGSEYFMPGGPAFRAVDAAFGPSGEVLVLDQLWPAVHRFDSTGTYLGSLGSKGSGPGELTQPTSFAVSPESGRLALTDGRATRIALWESEGTEIGSVPRRTAGRGSVHWGRGDQLYVRSIQPRGSGISVVLEAVLPGALRVRTIASAEQNRLNLFGRGGPAICAVCPVAISDAGHFAFVPDAADTYEILVVAPDSAVPERRIRGTATVVKFDREELRAEEKSREQLPAHLRTLMPRRSHLPLIVGLNYDEQGALWVQVSTRHGSRFDVFSPAGIKIQEFRASEQIVLLDVRGGNILALRYHESLGDFQVQVFRPVVAR